MNNEMYDTGNNGQAQDAEERLRNIARLRREAEAKLTHADALQAETDFLISTAQLSTQEGEGNS